MYAKLPKERILEIKKDMTSRDPEWGEHSWTNYMAVIDEFLTITGEMPKMRKLKNIDMSKEKPWNSWKPDEIGGDDFDLSLVG